MPVTRNRGDPAGNLGKSLTKFWLWCSAMNGPGHRAMRQNHLLCWWHQLQGALMTPLLRSTECFSLGFWASTSAPSLTAKWRRAKWGQSPPEGEVSGFSWNSSGGICLSQSPCPPRQSSPWSLAVWRLEWNGIMKAFGLEGLTLYNKDYEYVIALVNDWSTLEPNSSWYSKGYFHKKKLISWTFLAVSSLLLIHPSVHDRKWCCPLP